MKDSSSVSTRDICSFWEANPLGASAIPYPLGTKEYFEFYDQLRQANESLEFSYRLHEYRNFADKKVLDVGCGNGYILSKYAQEGSKVCGIDITSAAIHLSRRRFELLNLPGAFFVANAEELPFEDQAFDCVCSMGVLHHTPNTKKTVGEIYRVLKPGGRLIVMFYHRNSALYRLKFSLISLLTYKTIQQSVNEVDGVGNPKGDVYSKSELRYLLRRFEELDIFAGLLQGWMILPKLGRFIPNGLLRPFEKRWGWFVYAKGVKSTM